MLKSVCHIIMNNHRPIPEGYVPKDEEYYRYFSLRAEIVHLRSRLLNYCLNSLKFKCTVSTRSPMTRWLIRYFKPTLQETYER
jgi:hypothetical protein